MPGVSAEVRQVKEAQVSSKHWCRDGNFVPFSLVVCLTTHLFQWLFTAGRGDT